MTKEKLKIALEGLEEQIRMANGWQSPAEAKAITAIKEALAQPEQEPVVWMYQDKSTHDVRFQKHMRGFVDHGATYETPLYTSPPQQELVCVCGAVWEGQELIYTTPQRTWVGLTNQEKEAVIDNNLTPACVVLAVEAKLKEKNT